MRVPAFFHDFPAIETPRLVLRRITADDAKALFATFSDASVMEFYGDPPHATLAD